MCRVRVHIALRSQTCVGWSGQLRALVVFMYIIVVVFGLPEWHICRADQTSIVFMRTSVITYVFE
jgi:hypothetical protein